MLSEVIVLKRYCRAWVIGGDGRYAWAAKSLLGDGLPIKCWGVPGMKNDAEHLSEALQDANLVLLPMNPFRQETLTVDGESVEAALLPKILAEGAVLVAGSFPVDMEAWLQSQGVRCVSLLELEPYLLANANTTAEGAVYLSLKNLDRTLSGAEALVIGWGRIGRFLAQKLRAMGAHVTVSVRSSPQKAELELLGYETEETHVYRKGLRKYDLILNTVPRPVMTLEQGMETRENCVIVELASLPGGFSEKLRRERKIIMAQALPGKTAPRTAGDNMAAAVWECLSGEGRTLE